MKARLFAAMLVCFFSSLVMAQSDDSVRVELKTLANPDVISDSTAFFEGFNEALDYPRLAIRSVGDPGHVSTCEYYAYERYGVHLEMTGDIILDESIFDRNKGFNRVMKQRILDSIPQWADSIGVVDDNWIEFDLNIMQKFIALFDFEVQSDSSALVTLIPERISESIFINLEGIEITDARSKKVYGFETLANGAVFEVKGQKSYRGYMRLNFEKCTNVNYVCTGRLTLPFTIQIE